MAVLNIVGVKPEHSLQEKLAIGQPIIVGRAPRSGVAVYWDDHISREHAEVTWTGSKLRVKCLETARNPLLFAGRSGRELELAVEEEFRIGTTRFCLAAGNLVEYTVSSEELQNAKFANPEARLEQLAKLPELIASAKSEDDLATKLVDLLLMSVPTAAVAAVLQYPVKDSERLWEKPAHFRWNSRDTVEGFRPSQRLIRRTFTEKVSVVHAWEGESGTDFTRYLDFDFAFCVPVAKPWNEGWCIYVAGRLDRSGAQASDATKATLQNELKFVELLANFLGAILENKQLRTTEGRIGRLLPSAVMEALRQTNSDEIIAPRETDVTILFCDVRGFSRKAEEYRHKLGELLQRVTAALAVMTSGIVKYDGIIADFQGDAALGFWGWPKPLEDGPITACRAALEILAQFSSAARCPQDPLADFRVGIGIAHGRAIAGKIGTDEQDKVGVFGPTVNVGSRLEGMTKQLRAPIVIDETTAAFVRQHIPPSEARVRRLARVKPAGMDDAFWVSELLPPLGSHSSVSDEQIAQFEIAADAVVAGNWSYALELLYKLPADDRVKEFLILHLLQHQVQPPLNWDGVLSLTSK